MCSNTTFVETDQRFLMVCPTPPTLFLQISLRTPGAPSAPTAIEVTTVEVDQSEVTKEPEKSASVGNQS